MWKVAGIVPDIHIPYHHKRALENTLKCFESVNVDAIYLLGDCIDLYWLHDHGPKDPRIPGTLTGEIEGMRAFCDDLDNRFPRAKKHYIFGNHEHRFERFILKNCPQLFSVTDLEHILDLAARPAWFIHSYKPTQLVPVLGTSLFARHEPYSMASAKASATKAMVNLVYGHIHRVEEFWTKTAEGERIVHLSPGWLGDYRFDKVFGYVKSMPNWNKGFTLAYCDLRSKKFHTQTHVFQPDGSINFHGEVFK